MLMGVLMLLMSTNVTVTKGLHQVTNYLCSNMAMCIGEKGKNQTTTFYITLYLQYKSKYIKNNN